MVGQHIVIVTGAASGIGAAAARRFANLGQTVVLLDRNRIGVESVAAEIGGHPFELDIADEDEVNKTIETIERDIGPIASLINCAGPLQNTDRPESLAMRVWDRMTDVHLRGTYLMSVATGGRMVRRGQGSIVTIASVAGMRSGPLHAYGPAKAALINLVEGLAAEWGPAGVRVNCVSPGFVRTPATDRGFAHGVLDEKRLAASAALRRLVEVDEVVAAMEFLQSDRASGITGCNLPVDAGYLVSSHWQSYGERPLAG